MEKKKFKKLQHPLLKHNSGLFYFLFVCFYTLCRCWHRHCEGWANSCRQLLIITKENPGWHGVPQTLLSFPAPHPRPRKDVSTKRSRNKETSEPSANKHYSICSKISGGVFICCIGGKRSFVWPGGGGRKCHVLQCKPDLNALKYDLKTGDKKRLQLSNSGSSEQWASKGAEVFVFFFFISEVIQYREGVTRQKSSKRGRLFEPVLRKTSQSDEELTHRAERAGEEGRIVWHIFSVVESWNLLEPAKKKKIANTQQKW